MNEIDKRTRFLAVTGQHKGILFKVAGAYCKNAEDRKDLLQEMIIQLWNSFDRYDNQYKYSTWIYRIALNTAISQYRKENRRKQAALPLPAIGIELPDSGAADENAAQIGLLQQFIGDLKEIDRALLLLYLEEKSHREIAAIMGFSVTNVATKIARIKNILKQKFSNT